jgi:transcriptional regulator with XRE-family HTH domain
MSEVEMAERAFVSRPTLRRLERGETSVSLSLLARVLEVLSMEADLDGIAANDEVGHRLADARTPMPRRRSEPS